MRQSSLIFQAWLLEKMVKLFQSCEYPLLCALGLLSTFQTHLVFECLQMGLHALHESSRLENCTFTLQPEGTEGKFSIKASSTTTSHCWGLAHSPWEPQSVPAQRVALGIVWSSFSPGGEMCCDGKKGMDPCKAFRTCPRFAFWKCLYQSRHTRMQFAVWTPDMSWEPWDSKQVELLN